MAKVARKKIQHNIKLAGYIESGAKANTQQGDLVTMFKNDKGSIFVTHAGNGVALLTTKTGQYRLKQNQAMPNVFSGTADGTKVRFTHKKISAQLIHWS